MTGTQIKTLAETQLDGDTIGDADAISWINECMIEDMGVDARYLKSVGITTTDTTTWKDLPADFLAVYGIDVSDGSEYEGSYRVRNGKILFPFAGTFTVWYYALPAEITALEETPQTHPLLHKVISLFLASRFKSDDDDENPDAQRLMAEYEQKKRHALIQIDNPVRDSSPVIKVV